MPSDETIALDPVEFIPERVEVGLAELGIYVVDAEWGDSEHELFLVRQEKGEVPADRHPPNRTVTIKLQAKEDSGVSLAEAAQRLQEKVGALQENGGFVKRIFDSRRGFSHPVAAIVYGASLGGIYGWMFAQRGAANEVTLTLNIGPYFYGTKELETATFKEEAGTNRQLIWKVAEYLGTAPGLRRIEATNMGTKNWLSAIFACECKDYSSAVTAELHYKAGQLTALGASIKGGETYIYRSAITTTWSAFAASKITASGEMTHVGNRRIHVRVNGVPKTEVRLEWRVLGSPNWTVNNPVKLYASGYQVLDLGQVNIERAVLGNQQWQFRLAVNKGSGEGTYIYFYDVWPVPTEEYLKVSAVPHFVTPTELKNEDTFEQTSGNLNGKELSDKSGKWVTENSDGKEDFQVEPTYHDIHRDSWKDSATHIAKPPGGPYKTAIAAQLDINMVGVPNANTVFPAIMFNGLQIGGKGFCLEDERFWRAVGPKGEQLGPEEIWRGVVFGERWYTLSWKTATWYTLTVIISFGNFALGWLRPSGSTAALGAPEFLSTFTPTEGTPYIEDGAATAEGAGGTTNRRANDNFRVWIPDLDAVAFAGRSLEMRSDGVFRQGSTEDVWGKLVPDGFLPEATPGLLEARPSRSILIPSQGDLENIGDTGENKERVKERYFPGYHFASEAE